MNKNSIKNTLVGIMCSERYLAIDVGGTAIKYVMTDRGAEISKINDENQQGR